MIKSGKEQQIITTESLSKRLDNIIIDMKKDIENRKKNNEVKKDNGIQT